jgi:hypothetical protein
MIEKTTVIQARDDGVRVCEGDGRMVLVGP